MTTFFVGDRVIAKGQDGEPDLKGVVTYVIRDGSNLPWGYVMISSEDGTSRICFPNRLEKDNLTKYPELGSKRVYDTSTGSFQFVRDCQ